jgi:Na+/melibiose symporter-like transporter
MQYVGFTVFPLVGAGLSALGAKVHLAETNEKDTPYFTKYNLPAVFMMLMCTIEVLLLFFFFDREQDERKVEQVKRQIAADKAAMEEAKAQDTNAPDIEAQPRALVSSIASCALKLTLEDAVLLCLMLLNISSKGSIAVYETLGASYGYNSVHMSTITLSALFSGAGACGTLTLLSFQFLCKWFNDVQLILGGMLIMIIAGALLVDSGVRKRVLYRPLHLMECVPQAGVTPSMFYASVVLMYTIGYPIGHTAGTHVRTTCVLCS